MPAQVAHRHVTVIGAGIVGIACASYLLRDGFRVSLVDPDPPGEGCSKGNGGIFAPGACIPLAMPGILKQVPKWLLDPEAPLSVRWGYAPAALPWLLRFVAQSSQQRATANAKAQREVLARTFENLDPLVKNAGAQSLVRKSGYLYIYDTEASFEKSKSMWALRRSMGVRSEVLSGQQLRDLEPDLAKDFARAVFLPDEGYCTNPLDLSRALAGQFMKDGGRIERRRALGFEFGSDGPVRMLTDAGPMPLDALVVAAGAHSKSLARKLHDPVPLQALRGYNITIENPGPRPRLPMMVADRKFGMTPMEPNLLRVSGIAEIAALDDPPLKKWTGYFTRQATRMLPGIDTRKVTDWFGHRPALPDSVPVISTSSHFPSVFYAFGHGISGLTGAATTGKLIADLASDRDPGIDMTPYRIGRFRFWSEALAGLGRLG